MTTKYMASLELILLLLLPSCEALSSPNISPVALVRKTAANELAAVSAGGHYRYRFEETKARGTETRDMLETRDWLIGRVILRNGQPLPAIERQREDERLRSLLKDRARLEMLRREQSSRQESLRRLIATFPDAFNCEYDGTEEDSSGRKLDRLKFRPNPKFRARSWELRAFQGMRGTILIEPLQMRLVRLDSTFFRDVDFGYGFLGRIERGGTFLVEQQGLGNGRWAITNLSLHYNKRSLFVRSHVDSVTRAIDFRRVPVNLTLKQGITELLGANQMTDVLKKR